MIAFLPAEATATRTRPAPAEADRLVDYDYLIALTGLSARQVMNLPKDPTFPAKVKLGRLTRFKLSEVVAWINAQQEAR